MLKDHVSHAEMINLAIRCLAGDIHDIKARYENYPEFEKAMMEQILEKERKIDVLKKMYEFECGVAY